ncbi:MAG: D-glycero-beta-D-manno-heptose 1-phosphate adenylyltransferase [Candidatus Sumerlaeota bacterium]|nr:D-glycero-beta-D-manno-heptose 1-phosphate adenylyltransferase [Candidatus Sumerlaeota bacterium]
MSTRKKILDRAALASEVARRRLAGQRMVFTNGCFDLLHVGHARYLNEARRRGDYLVVAMNSDASTARLKGPERPIVPQDQRARILASFAAVDYVTIFDEDDPKPLLRLLRPEILVKGGNYGIEGVVGREMVEAYGGAVLTVALTEGASTTRLIETILGKSDALPRDYSG